MVKDNDAVEILVRDVNGVSVSLKKGLQSSKI